LARSTISHYRIVRKLGSGGMGEVFLAEDTTLGRKVAIKMLPEQTAGSDLARRRLINEAKAAAALDGRAFVVPDDIQRLAIPVLAHRLLLTVEAHASHRSAEEVVRVLLSRIRVPRGG